MNIELNINDLMKVSEYFSQLKKYADWYISIDKYRNTPHRSLFDINLN